MSIEVEIQSAPVINASVPPFVVGGGNPYAVLFTEQELSESQMAQARENIGAQESGDYLLGEDLDIVIDDIAKMKQDLADIQADLTVDTELSETSENPVQNKVIAQALSNFADEAGAALQQLAQTIPTDAHINSLIDAKLGVIENGTY